MHMTTQTARWNSRPVPAALRTIIVRMLALACSRHPAACHAVGIKGNPSCSPCGHVHASPCMQHARNMHHNA
eukprot:366106-Chlamydomonas_euryale.AAC.14